MEEEEEEDGDSDSKQEEEKGRELVLCWNKCVSLEPGQVFVVAVGAIVRMGTRWGVGREREETKPVLAALAVVVVNMLMVVKVDERVLRVVESEYK